MNKQELELAKDSLLKPRSELQTPERAIKANLQAVELNQSWLGHLSRQDAMKGHKMALETNRRRQQQLQKLEGALLRIDSRDYGDCFVCEEPIRPDRLMVDPSSTHCIQRASA